MCVQWLKYGEFGVWCKEVRLFMLLHLCNGANCNVRR